MAGEQSHSEFAKGDFSDERKIGEWESRYTDKLAKKWIRIEFIYVCSLLLVVCPVGMVLVWALKCGHICFGLTDNECRVFSRYSYALLSGLLGGTIYSAKWLYHSIAHGLWNMDRRTWRGLAPLVSGALGVVFVWMIDSELLSIFDGESVEQTPVVLTVGFLVGYFSDRALAKMSDVAIVLFGPPSKCEGKVNKADEK